MNWEPTIPVIVALITAFGGPLALYFVERRKLIDANNINNRLRKELADARESLLLPPMLSPEGYGIKIDIPKEYANVGRNFEVSGSFRNLPEGQVIWVSTFEVHDDGLGGQQRKYWPQNRASTSITAKGKTWRCKVENIGGRWSNEPKEYLVLVVGIEGQALFNYFKYAGEETDQWPAITQLTTDVVHCTTGKVMFIG